MQSSSWHSTSVFKGDKRFPGPANKRMQVTANSVCSCLAPASGGADAARRQAAGAASCLALPRRDQRRIGWRVTPRPDHRAIDRAPAPRRVTREQAWGDSRGERETQWSPGALASQAGGLVENASPPKPTYPASPPRARVALVSTKAARPVNRCSRWYRRVREHVSRGGGAEVGARASRSTSDTVQPRCAARARPGAVCVICQPHSETEQSVSPEREQRQTRWSSYHYTGSSPRAPLRRAL